MKNKEDYELVRVNPPMGYTYCDLCDVKSNCEGFICYDILNNQPANSGKVFKLKDKFELYDIVKTNDGYTGTIIHVYNDKSFEVEYEKDGILMTEYMTSNQITRK